MCVCPVFLTVNIILGVPGTELPLFNSKSLAIAIIIIINHNNNNNNDALPIIVKA